MNGSYAQKGFLIQSLVCLLDAFNEDKNKWHSVIIEPDLEKFNEKVDFVWIYKEKNKTTYYECVQVKSSINPFQSWNVKKWKNELLTNRNAEYYTLILVGSIDKKIVDDLSFANFEIKTYSDDFETLKSVAVHKLDIFFSNRNIKGTSPEIRTGFIERLITQFSELATNSMELSRKNLEKKLLRFLQEIEEEQHKSKLSLYQKDFELELADFTTEFLNLLGWNTFASKIKCLHINDHDLEFKLECSHEFNYLYKEKSNLQTDNQDIVLIKTLDISKETEIEIIKNKIITAFKYLADDIDCAIESCDYPFDINEKVEISVILLIFNPIINNQFFDELSKTLNSKLFADFVKVYLTGKNQIDFIKNSILHAKWFTETKLKIKANVKFLYPLTKNNLNINTIKSRDVYYCPQYINTTIIPIIIENSDNSYFFLFCSDKFQIEQLKRVLWLSFALTSGYATKYCIFFYDYDRNKYESDKQKIIESINDKEFKNRIEVHQLKSYKDSYLFSSDFEADKYSFSDEVFSKTDIKKSEYAHTAERIDTLLYGDKFQAVLNSIESLSSPNLMSFLHKKGIFYHETEKKKVTDYMSTLLFSPNEMEELKILIDDKELGIRTYTPHSDVKWQSKQSLSEVIKKNWKDIYPKLQKLYSDYEFTTDIEPTYISNNEVKFGYQIKKHQYNQIYENPQYPTGYVTFKVENEKLEVIHGKSANETAKINSAIKKTVVNTLQHKSEVSGEFIDVEFAHFNNKNSERIDFLRSFEFLPKNEHSLNKFTKYRVPQLKYTFADNENIPDDLLKYKQVGTNILDQRGRHLEYFEYIEKEEYKKSIVLEQITIEYSFDFNPLSNEKVTVIYNFSDALSDQNKNGLFQSSFKLVNSPEIKKLSVGGLKQLEKFLENEIETMKKNSYKRFADIFPKQKFRMK